ncbi:inositol monophosphatase family protein [Kaistia sp. MMO-174]|uniref:inositol monophosphatase family protein n=1 Tax=Kaistia sp. MMO-174 TaxID=3081256 RepID=UPI00301A61CC
MHSSEIARRHTFAQEIAREAGAIARRYFEAGDSIRATEKGAHDLVTEADLEIDRFLIGRLGQAFPGDGILTEESGGGEAANLWVIDPIDGTTNFSRRIPHFAMSIAFHAEGRTESGVVYNPILDEMFVARRGFGATCNGRSIRVRETRGPTDALIDAGYSSKRPLVDYVALVGRLLENDFAFVQNGSAAIGLAQVACGRIDGYCELFLHSWDVLAGLLLVEEAGGWASDFTADGGLLRGNAVLAGTPALREPLGRILPLGSALQARQGLRLGG